MQIKNFLTVALGASAVTAQSLTEALQSQKASLSLLTGLVGSTPGVADALSGAKNITILAPSNKALQTFLNTTAGAAAGKDPYEVAALLLYHVINGTYPGSAFTKASQFFPTALMNETFTNVTGGQVVGGMLKGKSVMINSGLLMSSKVIKADLKFNGGLIHIIDTVLTIPASDSDTATAANLTSLAGALTTANLVDTVNGLKDVTIFAPSNDAFGGISSITGNLSTEDLGNILKYHVIQGSVVYSSDIVNGTSVATVGGGNVTITVDKEGSVFVNSAKVITPDVLVANGVVHVIDGVLNPSNTTATPNASTTVPAFPGASSASAMPSGSGTSTSEAGAARTGAVGMGALFGGAMLFAANM